MMSFQTRLRVALSGLTRESHLPVVLGRGGGHSAKSFQSAHTIAVVFRRLPTVVRMMCPTVELKAFATEDDAQK